MASSNLRTIDLPHADIAMVSDQGNRSINQDCADTFSYNDVIVLALADGMGGHPRGEVAAQIFIDCARLLLRKHARQSFSAESYMQDVMQTADRKIKEFGARQQPPVEPRTTAVLVSIDRGQMQWSHLGDSRTYLFRHNRAHMRTLDHTPVELMRLKGALEDADSQSNAIGRSGVSRCLGSKRQPDQISVTPPRPLQNGDLLLLCTDGVWSQLEQQQLEELMLDSEIDLGARTERLVSTAVDNRSPRSDNATALALSWNTSDNHHSETAAEEGDIDNAIAQLQNLINKYN